MPAQPKPSRLSVAPAVVAGACAVVVLVALAPATAAARGEGPVTTVVVTMTKSALEVAPLRVGGGAVVFKIANKFPKSGSYLYLSYGRGHTAGLSGVLTVVDACTNPASTTVTVQMQEAAMKLSRQTVPCGTVTFVITNAGTIIHTFPITTPNNPALIAAGGQGPRVDPGQTETITVHLTTKGSAFYRCSEPEHDEQYGETGSLTVV